MRKRKGESRFFVKNKKGQSAIIATVLLILLVVATAVIIFSFVISFVKDKLSSGGCIDIVNKIQIVDDGLYTCYNNDAGVENVSVKVRIGDIRILIEGFKIEIDSVNSKTIEIKEGSTATGVYAYDDSSNTYVSPLKLPGDNGAITYQIKHSEKPNSVNIYPILKGGKVCDSGSNPVLIEYC